MAKTPKEKINREARIIGTVGLFILTSPLLDVFPLATLIITFAGGKLIGKVVQKYLDKPTGPSRTVTGR